MKKLIAVITAALMLAACAGLAACKKDPAEDWTYLQEKGRFIVGYTNYRPFAYTDESGKFTGFDVELARAVGEKLGLEVTFQQINWKKKVAEINGYNIDVIWNAMTITDELKDQIDFTDPYVNNNQVVVVKAGSESKYDTKEKIAAAGKKIALEGGASAYNAVKGDSVLKDAEILQCADQNAALQEVASGTSEIAVVDVIHFNSLESLSDSVVKTGNLVKIPAITFPPEKFGIGVRKGSSFLSVLKDALAELEADGTYARIAAQFNLTEVLVD